MFSKQRASARFVVRLLVCFLLLCAISRPLLRLYAGAVVPAASRVLNGLRPHDAAIRFGRTFPHVEWEAISGSKEMRGSESFYLLSYNLLLYIALVLSIQRWKTSRRGVIFLTGLPFLYVFHTADLILSVESKLLTALEPEHYAFWQHFSLWFVVVKFSHSFSVMALKQVLPILLLFLQCWIFERPRPGRVGAMPTAEDHPSCSSSSP